MLIKHLKHLRPFKRGYSTIPKEHRAQTLEIQGSTYPTDEWTNVTPKILQHLGRNLHTQPNHPLSFVRRRIIDFFYKTFKTSRGNPQFSVYDNLSPIVSTHQNFDSLLVPKNHVSRNKSDCYYINETYLLRAHTTCHQHELIKAGLDNFLIVGDVYRRDEIDRSHYPVFHQVDAVRLRTRDELFAKDDLQLFEVGDNTRGTGTSKQACHTLEAVKLMEHELKTTLATLAKSLFGEKITYRWVDSTFPFTDPSWELEVEFDGKWFELLGCGIMKQPILTNAGVTDKVGWAFGLGLERVAMILYKIPDIRLFWSKDSGFLSQFEGDYNAHIVFKPVSEFPQCTNDVSFWLPKDGFSSNDFYDLVREVGGDVVEQVVLKDEFKHPKSGDLSHCYRIVYRHMEKTLTQEEVNVVHKRIEEQATERLGVKIR